MVGGILVLIIVKNVYVKILGVLLNVLVYGLGEIFFLVLCLFYGKILVILFVVGSGVGIFFGLIYFIGKEIEFVFCVNDFVKVKFDWL